MHESTSLRAVPRVARSDRFSRRALTPVAVLIFLATALLPELSADRYGAPGYLATIPMHDSLESLAGPLHVLSVAVALFILLDLIAGTKIAGSGYSAVRFVPGQMFVWAPYAIAWTLSAFLGAVSGVDKFAWVSLAIVLGVSALMVPVIPSNFAVKASLVTNRVLIWGSLLAAFISHSRAFAPYSVWPGGWWAGADRLQGLLPHPNTLGWIAAVAILVELFGSRRDVRPIMVGVAVVALLLTGSRTASLAVIVGLICGLLYRIRASGKHGPAIAFGSIVIGIIGAIALLLVLGLSIDAFNGRAATWVEAFQAFGANWIMGSGPGAYLEEHSAVPFVAYAHNQVLQTAAESGLFGLIALALHVVWLISYVRRHARNPFGVSLVGMWFCMFASENLLRFASTGFVIQIVVFQLALFAATRYSPVARSSALVTH